MLLNSVEPSLNNSNVRSCDAVINLMRGVYMIGIRLPKKYRLPYILWSMLFNLLVTIYLPGGFLLSWIIESDKFSAAEFLTSLQVGINAWACCTKSVIFIFTYSQLLDAEALMDTLDVRCKEPEEKAKIRDVVTFGNRMFTVLVSCYWSYSVCTLVAQLLNGRPLYSLYNPSMNWRDGQKQLITQALFEYVLMNLICLQDVVLDSYPIIYVNIIRTHIQILTRRVGLLGRNFEGLKGDERYEELVQCILDHKNILELLNTVSPVISRTIFVQFLFTSCVVGVSLMNILLFADFYGIFASMLFILSVVLEIFPLCYFSNALMNDSDELTLSIFHSSWQAQDRRYKQILMFFMQNTQKKLLLTAMKLFPINMTSSFNIAKFAFSVYTLMHQMEFDKNFRT